MLGTTGTAGSNHRNGDGLFHRVDELDVKAGIGAIPVDAIQQDFAGTQLPAWASSTISAVCRM